MNFIIYKSELENQIKDYKEFIPLINDNDSMLKLMREIFKLVFEIKKIKEMNFEQLTAEFDIETIQRSSIINYLKSKV